MSKRPRPTESARTPAEPDTVPQVPLDTDTFFGQFFTRPAEGREDAENATQPGVPLGVIGDYELLDVLGEGGMGVVFRACQLSAERQVALKVIRPERLAERESEAVQRILSRFRTEARAAAQLEHDHIVRVYDVGELEGRHYYSMQLVDGPSLAQVLLDGPIDNRRAAAYLRSVASAVHEAHRNGILHRDLKPQNVLLDAESDRALVTDFGLAKVDEFDEGLTRAGETMGTPCYMSPEQARDAAHITPRSDVYSIGATLYHALTGRPVFHAPTAVETLRQVIDEAPVAPRELNRAVVKDLNTICLKCLEKAPESRYASAAEVADELQRYLDGVPIIARPVGVVGRLWRWSIRNPLAGTFAGAAIACLFMAFAALVIGYAAATVAHRRSEESFRYALQTVNVFFTRVSEETLLDQPGLQPLRKDLLLQARGFYQRFLSQREGDSNLRHELAVTRYRVGVITAEVESAEAALGSFSLAAEEQRQLLAADPDSAQLLSALGQTLNEKAKALFALQRFDESETTFRESQQLREKLVALHPTEIDYSRKLANTIMNIGVVVQAEGELDRALQLFQEAQSMRERLLAPEGNHDDLLRDLAKAYYNLGRVLYASGDLLGAQKNLELGVERFKVLPGSRATLDDRYALGLCYDSLADLDQPAARRAKLYRLALQELNALAVANPNVDRFQAAVARADLDLGQLELDRLNSTAARESLQRAMDRLTRLVARNPEPSYRRDLVVSLHSLGLMDLQVDPTQALVLLGRAAQNLDELTAQFPANDEYLELRQSIDESLGAARRAAQ